MTVFAIHELVVRGVVQRRDAREVAAVAVHGPDDVVAVVLVLHQVVVGVRGLAVVVQVDHPVVVARGTEVPVPDLRGALVERGAVRLDHEDLADVAGVVPDVDDVVLAVAVHVADHVGRLGAAPGVEPVLLRRLAPQQNLPVELAVVVATHAAHLTVRRVDVATQNVALVVAVEVAGQVDVVVQVSTHRSPGATAVVAGSAAVHEALVPGDRAPALLGRQELPTVAVQVVVVLRRGLQPLHAAVEVPVALREPHVRLHQSVRVRDQDHVVPAVVVGVAHEPLHRLGPRPLVVDDGVRRPVAVRVHAGGPGQHPVPVLVVVLPVVGVEVEVLVLRLDVHHRHPPVLLDHLLLALLRLRLGFRLDRALVRDGLVLPDELPGVLVVLLDRFGALPLGPVVCSHVLRANLQVQVAGVLVVVARAHVSDQITLVDGLPDPHVVRVVILDVTEDHPDLRAVRQGGLDLDDRTPPAAEVSGFGHDTVR